jgi:D-arabinose 1-dehydrogenase-like Zn-dependent alcohol dehydrogenase
MMVKLHYDNDQNVVVLEFEGNVDVAEARKSFDEMGKTIPQKGKGFRLLTDFSKLDTIDLSVKSFIEKAMELFKSQGVTEIIRVIPDPNMEVGMNLISTAHYPKNVKVHTVRSRQEAKKYLNRSNSLQKMRAVQVSRPGGALELVEREIPQPEAGQVRIKVLACGICHSDSLVKESQWPGIQYPRVPGHEVVGVVDEVGPGVTDWTPGQRAGVGWHGGHCGHCDFCRRGSFLNCKSAQITGLSFDGGYADYMIAPAVALAHVPDELSSAEAAPLMCAGITTYNALRNSDAKAGDLVAILGLGGLGHLGVQYAVKMGFKTVGIARGKDKELLVRKLGAHHYIDSQAQDPAAELQKLGGAKVILATATDGGAMSAATGGLATKGTFIIVGAAQSMQVSPIFLLMGTRSIKGWASGTAVDSQDTLAFSAQSGVRSMNETFPLERANEAYERMMSGKARFRVVLTV